MCHCGFAGGGRAAERGALRGGPGQREPGRREACAGCASRGPAPTRRVAVPRVEARGGKRLSQSRRPAGTQTPSDPRVGVLVVFNSVPPYLQQRCRERTWRLDAPLTASRSLQPGGDAPWTTGCAAFVSFLMDLRHGLAGHRPRFRGWLGKCFCRPFWKTSSKRLRAASASQSVSLGPSREEAGAFEGPRWLLNLCSVAQAPPVLGHTCH